jgi:cbb3-type cytochrome c oxidase subunit III
VEYNCYGCHGGLAGGAMGPSLRDTVWKFGGTDAQIQATINEGRPYGMPAWGKTLSDAQVKDIIAYIRSMRTTAEPKFFFINAQMKDSLRVQ